MILHCREYYNFLSSPPFDPTPVGFCEYDCYRLSHGSGTKTAYYTHDSYPGCL